MIRIIIVDDHPIIRYGLRQIIMEEDDMKIISEAESGEQLFKLLDKNEYDILILDICLPDMDGLQILKIVKQSKPNLPILMLSALSEGQYAMKAIKDGASGYLNKIAASDQLIKAIREILAGRTYVNSSIRQESY
jgi:DNA-binding NarL/FixJ family response regulator